MKRLLPCLTWGLVVLGVFPVCAADWKVGIAKTEITPTKPVWMAGYAARKHPSEGTIHPLWAKALVVEDGRQTYDVRRPFRDQGVGSRSDPRQ